MDKVSVIWADLLQSFGLNCFVFFVTLLVALPLGLILSFGSMNKWAPMRFLAKKKDSAALAVKLANFHPLSFVVKTIVWIIRGTPLMLQIFVLYYGPGLLFNATPPSRLVTACIAFVINYSCYFSEIYRGGIQSVPRGQSEAGQVLGMTKSQIFFKVTLLQVVKRVIPPMGNEFMTLIKDTALANVIMNEDIIKSAKDFAASDGLIWPLFSTALFFLLFCGILTLLLGWVEKKLDYFRA